MKPIGNKSSGKSTASDNLNIDLFANKAKFIEKTKKSSQTSIKVQDVLEAVISIVLTSLEADACSIFLFNSQTAVWI